MRKRRPFWLIRVGILLLLLVVSSSAAYAFQLIEGNTVSIGAGEVIDDDLYIAAETFTLDGTITGDLYVAGKLITINGVVEGDIVAAGQTIILNGTAGDDVRIAAASVIIGSEATIADDLVVGLYSLEQQAGSQIGGSLLMAGKQALLAGQIQEDVLAATSGLHIQGTIGGHVRAEVAVPGSEPPFDMMQFFPDSPPIPVVPNGLTFGNEARIGGDLNYSSETAMDVSAKQVGGNISHTPISRQMMKEKQEHKRSLLGTMIHHIRRFAVLFLLGWLIIWLVPALLKRLASRVQEQPALSLGWGIIVLLGFIVAIVVAFVGFVLLSIILGGPFVLAGFTTVTLAILAFLIIASYLSKIVVGYVAGKLLLDRIRPDLAETPLWSLLAGLMLVVLFLAIPILGGILNLLMVLAGFGALWLMMREPKLQPTS